MARQSPEQQVQRILKTIRGWETRAPRGTFSRHTLPQFKAAMQPALDAHAKVLDLRKELRFALHERNVLVRKALQLVYLVGFSVRGSPDHGVNSELSEALGYTRESVRRERIRRGRRKRRK